jgi:uncharacterized membrane protein
MKVEDSGAGAPAADSGRAAAQQKGRLWDALVAVVALVGLIDATYLTVEHVSGRNVRCLVTSGCDAVLASRYAVVADTVPLAALGALAYFTAFSLATLAAFGYRGVRAPLALLVAAMLAATLWLLYVQAFILQAFCSYCLLSAAVTFTLTLLVLGRRLFGPKQRLP